MVDDHARKSTSLLQPNQPGNTQTGLSLDGEILHSESSKLKIDIHLLHNFKALANETKVLINHITNTPGPHPSVGEGLSPLVGGDADM